MESVGEQDGVLHRRIVPLGWGRRGPAGGGLPSLIASRSADAVTPGAWHQGVERTTELVAAALLLAGPGS